LETEFADLRGSHRSTIRFSLASGERETIGPLAPQSNLRMKSGQTCSGAAATSRPSRHWRV